MSSTKESILLSIPRSGVRKARALFGRNLGAGEDFLLYCGGIDACKNLSFLHNAFRTYCGKTREPRKLLIVGDPHTRKPSMDPLEKLVEDRSLSDSLVFTGQVSDELLRRLYCAAGLFIYPSKMEGFGYSPLAAMAYGCPVLCSNAAALPETVGQAAHLLPPEDPEVWADEIGLLIEDEKRREELVKEGYEGGSCEIVHSGGRLDTSIPPDRVDSARGVGLGGSSTPL